MKKIIVMLFLIIMSNTAVVFAETELAEMEFLTIVPDARQTAIGNCGLVFSRTIFSAQSNPAQLVLADRLELVGSYISYLADTNYSYLGLAIPVNERIVFGITSAYLDGGKITQRDFEGRSGTTLSNVYSGRVYTLASAIKFLKTLSFGVNTKIVNEELYGSTNYLGMDTGFLFNLPNFSLGLGIQNVSLENFPTTLNLGSGYRFVRLKNPAADEDFRNKIWSVELIAECAYRIKYVNPWGRVGVEFCYPPISIRSGCDYIGRNEFRWTLGLGFELSGLSVDYSYVPYSGISDTHRVSCVIPFSKSIVEINKQKRAQSSALKLFESAKELFEKNEFESSLLDIQNAAHLWRENPEIISFKTRVEKVCKDTKPPSINIAGKYLTNKTPYVLKFSVIDDTELLSVIVDGGVHKYSGISEANVESNIGVTGNVKKIKIVATDKKGNVNEKEIDIVFDRESPKLVIESPEQKNVQTYENSAMFVGRVEDNNEVAVLNIANRNIPIEKKKFDFTEKIDLVAGNNKIKISARDTAGNETLLEYVIQYTKIGTAVAVIEFDARNTAPVNAMAVTDFIRDELVKLKVGNIIERSNMKKILNEQKFQMSECTTSECAVKLGKLLSANKIVLGTVTQMGWTYLVNVRIINVETGVIEWSDKSQCKSLDELQGVAETLAKSVSEHLAE